MNLSASPLISMAQVGGESIKKQGDSEGTIDWACHGMDTSWQHDGYPSSHGFWERPQSQKLNGSSHQRKPDRNCIKLWDVPPSQIS